MSFTDLAKKRCSIRAYDPDPVEPDKIAAIVEAAHVAPSAANRQPVRLIQVESAEGLANLGRYANLYGAPLAFIVCAWASAACGSARSTPPACARRSTCPPRSCR